MPDETINIRTLIISIGATSLLRNSKEGKKVRHPSCEASLLSFIVTYNNYFTEYFLNELE